MSRKHAQKLAAEFILNGNPTGWFEILYAEAGNNYTAVPWADLAANPNLIEWATKHNLIGQGKSALTIGCGYGDDAEFLAEIGFRVTAFDISPTAIAQCKQRFPNSQVSYQVADLLKPPDSWWKNFYFVFESYTLQVLPPQMRLMAISNIADFVAPSGKLLVIARGREESDSPGEMPYPLTKGELHHFQELGLKTQIFEDYFDKENPPNRRFRILYSANI